MPIKRISGKAQNSLSEVKNEGSGANLIVSKKEAVMELITADNAFLIGVGAFLAAAAIVVVSACGLYLWVVKKERGR